ncbi:hypothetical protein D3C85_1567450 [compost metagenome]
MPSSNQCTCSAVSVGTASAEGQMNLSFSRRLSNSQKPLRSHPRIFTRSRRRLLNTYAHEANGSRPSACSTSTAKPLMLNRKSTGSRCR